MMAQNQTEFQWLLSHVESFWSLGGALQFQIHLKPNQKLKTFHHKCSQQIHGITLWHCLKHGVSMAKVFEKTKLLPIEKTIEIRQIRFLERVSNLKSTHLTHQIMTSQASKIPNVKGSTGHCINTCSACKNVLEKAGLATTAGAELSEWIPKLLSSEAHDLIENNLELPPGSLQCGRKLKKRPQDARNNSSNAVNGWHE